ncbi:hypothetical protein AB685_10355 [Bacillus sp. LL01]|uniref:nuclease-related domain-containing protein n=1 Tax=Bacillus sp. LL01 TaxID=1665556 RepID=UPI00064CFB7C|nr:nuclease-related domain-containing protein [Bacillus sp. LL01]KMJ58302.1 hypothetical protein AB685_10355 [Bacillus sp. LL01]
MIVKKERQLSQVIQVLTALDRRLHPNNPKRAQVKKELAGYLSGYKGEESIDYFLELLTGIGEDFYVFHDIRLPFKNHYFQIDTLLLFPSFILILEVKNHSGTVVFDPAFQQMIQKIMRDGLEEELIWDDPIEQVLRQSAQLGEWIKVTKQPYLPCESLVVMTNNKTKLTVKSHQSTVEKYVTRSTALGRRIKELYNKYPREKLNKKDLKKVVKVLLSGNEPFRNTNTLDKYGVTSNEILRGVHCLSCNQLGMRLNKGQWECPNCKFRSKLAHIETLKDFSLLLNSTISISEFGEFIGVKSPTTLRRLLNSEFISFSGKTKLRRYFLV